MRVADGVAGVAAPAAFSPSICAVCVNSASPGTDGTASAATAMRNGTTAVAPAGIVPRNSTAKPVMRCVGLSVGVAGSPAPSVSSTGAGFTSSGSPTVNQVTVASVAPSGHAAPAVRNPSKRMSSLSSCPSGCEIVSESSGPFEALTPVTVEIVVPPAGMRVVENDVTPVTAEVRPPIV